MAKKYFLLLITSLLFTIGYPQVQELNIGDAVIHYTDSGKGAPVVFVHGSLGDYRSWEPQRKLFSDKFRVITYSRRYNYPNENILSLDNYSAETEADDLARIVKELNLDNVHLIGHSFGALIALNFAKKYPDMVRSLVISEPPLVNWLPKIDGGQPEWERVNNYLLRPVQIAFDLRDTVDVLRHTFNYFMGSDKPDLPDDARAAIIANLGEWKVVVNSPNAFSGITQDDVKNLKMPVMMITAGNTLSLLKLTNAELARMLPDAYHFHLADAQHDLWKSHSEVTSDAVRSFLSEK